MTQFSILHDCSRVKPKLDSKSAPLGSKRAKLPGSKLYVISMYETYRPLFVCLNDGPRLLLSDVGAPCVRFSSQLTHIIDKLT